MSKLVKICGKRSAFLSFISIICALLFVYGFYAEKIYVSIVSISLFSFLLVFAILNKYKPLYIALSVFFIIFCLLGFCNFNYVDNIKIKNNQEYLIVGKIPTVINIEDSYFNFILEDATIIAGDKTLFSHQRINFIAYCEDLEVKSGDIVKITEKLTKEELFNYGKFNSYKIANQVYFSCFTLKEFEKIDNNLNLKDKAQLKVKEAFFSSMDRKSASLAYGVTFGDKSAISSTVLDGFRYSGLAHILAVSGLHTSIIFMLIAFALSRIKRLNKIWTGIIIASILLMYAYMCSFAPSIVRACIMCIVSYFTLCGKLKYDMLNSLGVSAIIVLLFNPFDLFNVGFCLSFACMFGIALFTKPLMKLFSFLRAEFIISTLAMTTATQIATLPFMAYYFGYFSFIGFIANLILLPIFTFIFTFIIIGALLSLIFTPTILLGAIGFVLNIFIDLSVALSGLDFLIVPLCKIGIVGILAFFILLFILNNRIFVKQKLKLLLCACLIAIVTTSCVVSTLPTTIQNNLLKVQNTENSYYYKLNNNLTLVNPFGNSSTFYEARQTLNYQNEKSVENIVVLSNVSVKVSKLKEFAKDVKIGNIYIPAYLENELYALIEIFKEKSSIILMQDDTIYNIGTNVHYSQLSYKSCFISFIINESEEKITSFT